MQIIDTPGRGRLATFFLAALPRSFHPEEVRKLTGQPGSVVVSNLRHFARSGFLLPFERKGEIYYRLNQRYPYLEELRSYLIRKTVPRVRDLVTVELTRLPQTSIAVLTGLFSGQKNMPTDILIVGTPPTGSLRRILEKIEKEIRQELNYTVFNLEEFAERVNMYDRFTRDLFENPHLVVFDRRPKPRQKQKTETSKKKKK